MIIKTLVENTAVSKEFKSKHGISFYIEACGHRMLFDLGSNSLFLVNAKKMGVDISSVDTVIISHGHVDHAGALEDFLRNNSKAKIYIRQNAFDCHFTKVFGLRVDVGIEPELKNHPFIEVHYGEDNRRSLHIHYQGKKLKIVLPEKDFMPDISASDFEAMDDFFLYIQKSGFFVKEKVAVKNLVPGNISKSILLTK